MLQGKKIILGVTGGIAAYKSAYIVRGLIKKGAEVKVIMTASASSFITPLTLATLSKNPVVTEFVADSQGSWNNHVELGLWADLMIVAPATANTIAKIANGLCDNLLTATYLSARCPVMVCPAMDLDMYQHPAVLNNLSKLQNYGNIIINAESGELASGLIGKGRLADTENIVKEIIHHFTEKRDLLGKKVLITAGPTYESIDPVRFIGNHSSGKMGFAIGLEFLNRGAEVVMVVGPTKLSLTHPNLEIINITSADEMLEECKENHSDKDIVVFCAAVADYKPKTKAVEKIKKSDNELQIDLVKNPDIASILGKDKSMSQIHVGFALETNNEEVNAKEKLQKKNFDLIVLNSLQDGGAGFQYDTNKITIIDNNKIRKFELKSKKDVAIDIVDVVSEKIYE